LAAGLLLGGFLAGVEGATQRSCDGKLACSHFVNSNSNLGSSSNKCRYGHDTESGTCDSPCSGTQSVPCKCLTQAESTERNESGAKTALGISVAIAVIGGIMSAYVWKQKHGRKTPEQEQEEALARAKCEKIFEEADRDGDGFLGFSDFKWLTAATSNGQELTQNQFDEMAAQLGCHDKLANKLQLYEGYTKYGAGSIDEDYEKLFGPGASPPLTSPTPQPTPPHDEESATTGNYSPAPAPMGSPVDSQPAPIVVAAAVVSPDSNNATQAVPAQAKVLRSGTSKIEIVTHNSGRLAQQNPAKFSTVRMLIPAFAIFGLGYWLLQYLLLDEDSDEGSKWHDSFGSALGFMVCITLVLFIIGHVVIRLSRMRAGAGGSVGDILLGRDNPVHIVTRVTGQLAYMVPIIGVGGIIWAWNRFVQAGNIYHVSCVG